MMVDADLGSLATALGTIEEKCDRNHKQKVGTQVTWLIPLSIPLLRYILSRLRFPHRSLAIHSRQEILASADQVRG